MTNTTKQTEAISTERALKLALEALESCDAAHITDGGRQWYDEKLVDKAVEAIEKALASEAKEQPAPGRAHYEDGDVFERIAAMKKQPAQQQEPVKPDEVGTGCECVNCQEGYGGCQKAQPQYSLEEYDAGLLNDFGGGNVEWWQDYIRAELGRAYEHYQSQMPTYPQQEQQRARVGDSRFESWFSEAFDPNGKGTKQQMREAYEAGMNDTSPPAQPQEPVAWIRTSDLESLPLVPPTVDDGYTAPGQQLKKTILSAKPHDYYGQIPLYTSPPANKPWVGLTDEQWQSIADTLGCIITRGQKDAIEAKLKEKNT